MSLSQRSFQYSANPVPSSFEIKKKSIFFKTDKSRGKP